MTDLPHNRITLGAAAKLVSKSRKYIHELIADKRLKAWKVGGSKGSPWLQVDALELRRVVDADQVYQPPAITTPSSPRRHQPKRQRLHPFAAGMLSRPPIPS